jgi:hypothetical protein
VPSGAYQRRVMGKLLHNFAREMSKDLRFWPVKLKPLLQVAETLMRYERLERQGMGSGMLGNTKVGGVLMKTMRLMLPAFILLVAASTAFPDSDPKIVLGGGGSCESFVETALTQTFHVETQTGGCVGGVDFTNEINDGTFTLDLLVVNVDTPFTGLLSCALAPTGSPLNTAFQSSPTSCTFEDATFAASILPGGLYNLNFLNDSSGSWPSFIDITLAQTVIPAPEPASMLLLGIGVMGLLVGSKSRGLKRQAS